MWIWGLSLASCHLAYEPEGCVKKRRSHSCTGVQSPHLYKEASRVVLKQTSDYQEGDAGGSS